MNLSKNNELSYVMYMNILNEKDKEINFFYRHDNEYTRTILMNRMKYDPKYINEQEE